MSQTRTVVIERNHDYLYDKVYQLSSERDHARATYRACASSDRIQVVPNYPTMFSDLKHFPRTQVKLTNKDPVPKFINRHWRGFSDQARLMMKSLSKLGDSSAVIGRYLPDHGESVEVGGIDRFRYFRRPIIPYASQLPPDVVLAVNQSENIYQVAEEETYHAPTRSIGTQTKFRDSDVQTDPYTPEYLVRPGEAPEVLTLASLTYGRGLPARLHEIEMIDRARHRRELESQLPPLNDFSQSEKRRKMMDAIETEEWAIREREIEELQKLRLEVLIKLLRQREEAYQEMGNQKLDRLWNRKQQEKEKLFQKLRSKYVKAIRQLLKVRKNVENKHVSRNIICDYSEGSSQIWAPLTRVGQFLDRSSQQYVVNSRYLTTYSGLLELEESLPSYVLNPKITVPKQNQYTNAGYKKRKYREEEKLRILHESIKQTTSVDVKVEKPLRFLQKIEKPVPRPATPTVEIPSENEEDEGINLILIQQIIRGRAIQAMMFEGKQKRKELIEELRSTNSLLTNEMQIDKDEKAVVINLQRQRMLLEHREERIDEALSYLEGETMAEMFDFLSKELLRAQEERRIHAFSMLAERERRIREAEESGLRQVEERRRREQDEIFKQVVKMNQNTVEEYLKEVINSNIEWSASNMSRVEIEELAQKVTEEAYESELTNTKLQQEEIVADLIHNFLIPEVHKRSVQEKIENTQRKFLYTAHKEIFNITDELIDNDNHQEAQVNTDGSEENDKRDSEDREQLVIVPGGFAEDSICEPVSNIHLISGQLSEDFPQLSEEAEKRDNKVHKSLKGTDSNDASEYDGKLDRDDTHLQQEEDILDDDLGDNQETGRDDDQETGRDDDQETGREDDQETGMEDDQETGRENDQETGREDNHETEREYDQETEREYDQETEREDNQETEREYDQETEREYDQETEREDNQETEREYNQNAADDE